MELRAIRDADIPALVDLAERGIHDRDAMPFSFPWSTVPAAELGRNMAAFYWRKRAEFSASASREQRRDGELAISQRLVLRPEDLRRPRYDVHIKGVRRFADSSDSTPERPLMPRATLVRTCDGWQPNGSFHG
jgi:hypothetical protein